MEPKSEKHVDLEKLKKQIEDAAGQTIEIGPDQISILRYPVGAHDSTEGTVLWRSIIFPGRSCVPANLLDGSGRNTTGANGSITFLLSSAICLPQVRSLAAPINLQATVFATTPHYLTTSYSLVADPNSAGNFNDVEITVNTWDAKGNPAAGIGFDWRCRLVSNPIIF